MKTEKNKQTTLKLTKAKVWGPPTDCSFARVSSETLSSEIWHGFAQVSSESLAAMCSEGMSKKMGWRALCGVSPGSRTSEVESTAMSRACRGAACGISSWSVRSTKQGRSESAVWGLETTEDLLTVAHCLAFTRLDFSGARLPLRGLLDEGKRSRRDGVEIGEWRFAVCLFIWRCMLSLSSVIYSQNSWIAKSETKYKQINST